MKLQQLDQNYLFCTLRGELILQRIKENFIGKRCGTLVERNFLRNLKLSGTFSFHWIRGGLSCDIASARQICNELKHIMSLSLLPESTGKAKQIPLAFRKAELLSFFNEIGLKALIKVGSCFLLKFGEHCIGSPKAYSKPF